MRFRLFHSTGFRKLCSLVWQCAMAEVKGEVRPRAHPIYSVVRSGKGRRATTSHGNRRIGGALQPPVTRPPLLRGRTGRGSDSFSIQVNSHDFHMNVDFSFRISSRNFADLKLELGLLQRPVYCGTLLLCVCGAWTHLCSRGQMMETDPSSTHRTLVWNRKALLDGTASYHHRTTWSWAQGHRPYTSLMAHSLISNPTRAIETTGRHSLRKKLHRLHYSHP
jgi:hypothetical protein